METIARSEPEVSSLIQKTLNDKALERNYLGELSFRIPSHLISFYPRVVGSHQGVTRNFYSKALSFLTLHNQR